jgi:sugar phosphate isomerase/epimerase
MDSAIHARLGLGVPHEWWPSARLLKSYEAAGFALVQVPSPPESMLLDARQLSRHGEALRTALATTALVPIVHAPATLLVGTAADDRAFEGLLAYAAEIGAPQVVYHAHALPDHASVEDRLLAETRSLARLAARAGRLGVTIAIENLAPVYPGPERLSDTPLVLRGLVHRIASPSIGLCLDVGHAHIVSGRKHTSIERLIAPALDSVVLFHLHDNLAARWDRSTPAGPRPAAARRPPSARPRQPPVVQRRIDARRPRRPVAARGPPAEPAPAGRAARRDARGALCRARGSACARRDGLTSLPASGQRS